MEPGHPASIAFILLLLGAVIAISGILIVVGIRLVRSPEIRRGVALLLAVVAWLLGAVVLSLPFQSHLVRAVGFPTVWLVSASLMWFVVSSRDPRYRGVAAFAGVTTCLALDMLFKRTQPFGIDEELSGPVGAFIGAAISGVLFLLFRRCRPTSR